MLEQNLKGQYRRAYLDYSRHRKENCPWKVLRVVNFAALGMLNLVFLNHMQENNGLIYAQYMLAKR